MTAARYRATDSDESPQQPGLTPEQERLVEAIVARQAKHPPVCLVGLDAETVRTLKDLAAAYQTGKTRARELFLKLAIWGLFLGVLAAVANFDPRTFAKQLLGIGQ